MGLSGVEVMGVGLQDLTMDAGEFKSLIAQSPMHVVSANIAGFLPYVRLRKNGGDLKVLITSVIDPEILQKYKIEYGGDISDPVSALKRLQKEIDHDLFIVIVHAMGEGISAIINGCSGIDLAVDGFTAAVSDNLDRDGVTPLICNNRRGQYVNHIEYRRSVAKSLTRPVLMRAGVGLVKEDGEIKILVQAYDKEKIAYSKHLREERRRLELEKNPWNLYLGSRACAGCHGVSVEKWAQSQHAEAFDSLRRKGREDDGECLKCHVTGIGDKRTIGGFFSLAETPWMTNVQCEVCHGAGANHAQNPQVNKMKSADEKSCRKCHTSDTDPDFDYSEKLLLIEHRDEKR